MKDRIFKHQYFNSYYYSNIISNILSDDVELIGFISAFHESHGYEILKPFEKISAFHRFILFMIYEFFLNDMYEYDKKEFEYYKVNPPIQKLYAEWALSRYDLDYGFDKFIGNKRIINWEDIESYHDELVMCGYIEELSLKLSHEVFYILFSNRDLLRRFNIIMMHYVADIILDSNDENDFNYLFRKDGILKRVNIPAWVKKAVYFRDRGRCCNCSKDISGLVNIGEQKHFDHIIPLALGGMNDVSNFQLLCENCNLKKGGKKTYTSGLYEKWY